MSVLNRNHRRSRGLLSDHWTNIVGIHWQRLLCFVSISAVFVQNWVLPKQRCKTANFSKFLGSAWRLLPKSGGKLQFTSVSCDGWCTVSEKTEPVTHTGAWKLYDKSATWRLQIHSWTARLYQGETVYKPRSPNRRLVLCVYLRRCRVPGHF